ncbi:MAG TPA: type 4a pilus biogenesis protein PilO [Solirubrobacterales bacterium]|nr:type 4a pilus biogenesis protein PilO [Solirubrobacterales bacterium]
MSSSNRVVVAMLAIAALGVAFWMLALSPKRDELKKLDAKVEKLESSLAQHEAEVAEAEEARDEFASNYRELVVLGKAVPADDDTASLLVQLNGIAGAADVKFNTFTLESGGGEAPAPEAPAPEEAGSVAASEVTPTEAAASTLPLGAAVGPAGLAIMPYTLEFEGDFFELADFIKGLDSLVKTKSEKVAVDGRLMTIDGFSLEGNQNRGFPHLKATFSVTTYLTPPSQGATAGATAAGPATATPVATTIGGTP